MCVTRKLNDVCLMLLGKCVDGRHIKDKNMLPHAQIYAAACTLDSNTRVLIESLRNNSRPIATLLECTVAGAHAVGEQVFKDERRCLSVCVCH